MAVFITSSVARMSVAISGRCWSGPGFRGAHCAPNFPDVPTTEEATGHTWHKGVWRGFAAPKGLPKEIATQYETAIKKVWDSAEFKAFMSRRGFDMIYLDLADFAEFVKADNEDNGKALKSFGLAK